MKITLELQSVKTLWKVAESVTRDGDAENSIVEKAVTLISANWAFPGMRSTYA